MIGVDANSKLIVYLWYNGGNKKGCGKHRPVTWNHVQVFGSQERAVRWK